MVQKKKVYEIGMVCVYCGNQTEAPCCGEVHHEIGYETKDGEIILASEITEEMVII